MINTKHAICSGNVLVITGMKMNNDSSLYFGSFMHIRLLPTASSSIDDFVDRFRIKVKCIFDCFQWNYLIYKLCILNPPQQLNIDAISHIRRNGMVATFSFHNIMFINCILSFTWWILELNYAARLIATRINEAWLLIRSSCVYFGCDQIRRVTIYGLYGGRCSMQCMRAGDGIYAHICMHIHIYIYNRTRNYITTYYMQCLMVALRFRI